MEINYYWANATEDTIAFLRGLKATFIPAPREMSEKRLIELVKERLKKRNVILGVELSEFVDGFDNQPQFRTLPAEPAIKLARKIAGAKLPHGLYVLQYASSSPDDIIRAIRPNDVTVVRGSYHTVFHRRSTYDLLKKRNIPFELVSPFVDEAESRLFLRNVEASMRALVGLRQPKGLADENTMMTYSLDAAKGSFDYSFQTGAVLAEKVKGGYKLIDAACNEVVPYQTHALHFGNLREEHLSPRHDLNHYDTIHAEMNLLVRAMQNGVNFEGKTLFINMMPCPSCARTLVRTRLDEVVYNEVHSDGYAVELFEKAGIKTRKAGT